MVDFRKWLPVLLVVALMVGFSATANAQAFTCVANAGVPSTVRSEGLSELVGDVILNCTGFAPATPIVANIQVFLNTNITSRIINTSNNTTEATLLINDNIASPLFGTKVTDNSVAWLGVSIPVATAAPGTTTTLRITNVRANANQAGVSSTLVPNQIVMFISASGTQSIPINNPQQVVAFVQKGLSFATRNCADSDSASTGFQQCASSNKDLTSNPTKTSGQSISFNVKFSEGFANAFKVLGTSTQNTPGAVYSNSESGLVIPGTGIGLATNGTRLIARFANIPAGVQIFVTVADTRTGTGSAGAANGTSGTASAVIVSTTDPTGTVGGGIGGITAVGTTGSASCGLSGAASAQQPIVPVPLTGGAGAATWEVIGSSPTAIEDISFGVVVAFAASPATNSPATGTGTVSGNFAPISTVTTMSATAPIPRFADVPTSGTAVSITQCLTALLFPYIVNTSGYDTGIVISNTTSDPFGTGAQAGTCTLNFFGGTASGGTVNAVTTGVVNSGSQLVFTLGSGGNLGVTNTAAGFTGYMIAQCRFQFAHGFAFISNGNVAQGYLALVIPLNSDGTRSAQFVTQTRAEVLGQ